MFQLVAMNIYRKQLLRGVSWNQLNSENTEVVYPLNALKEPVQINCKKACSVMEQPWIINILQTYLLKNTFDPFHGIGFFLCFLKYIRKPGVAWCFHGALRVASAMKRVKSHLIFSYLFCYLTLIKLFLVFLTLLVLFFSSS